jgi:hypothetical protein
MARPGLLTQSETGHCYAIFASRMTFAHRSSSALIRAEDSSGVVPTGARHGRLDVDGHRLVMLPMR